MHNMCVLTSCYQSCGLIYVHVHINIELKQRINDIANPLLNSCGGIGWTRVAYLDMRDPGSACPMFQLDLTHRGCS